MASRTKFTARKPGRKTHYQMRKETSHLNLKPNDKDRREGTRPVDACQRCHHEFAKQFSVVGEPGARKTVAAQASKSHYCKECAKERQAELEAFDARPKKKAVDKPKPSRKRGAARKAASVKQGATRRRVRKVKEGGNGRSRSPRKRTTATSADPF